MNFEDLTNYMLGSIKDLNSYIFETPMRQEMKEARRMTMMNIPGVCDTSLN